AWSGGTIDGAGTIVIGSGIDGSIGYDGGYGGVQLNGRLNVAGVVVLGADGYGDSISLGTYAYLGSDPDTGNPIYETDPGQLNILAGGRFELAASSTISEGTANVGERSLLSNAGTLVKTGADTASINVDVVNTGNLSIEAGTLYVSGAFESTGITTITAGAVLQLTGEASF
ncbi:hypothetical protein, partial [Rhizobium sp. M1]|uniref:hypothetical protein n=1 Tax=Rhizobium sp. M1 TaxID=2035453 RepID=UPI000BEC77BE